MLGRWEKGNLNRFLGITHRYFCQLMLVGVVVPTPGCYDLSIPRRLSGHCNALRVHRRNWKYHNWLCNGLFSKFELYRTIPSAKQKTLATTCLNINVVSVLALPLQVKVLKYEASENSITAVLVFKTLRSQE